MPYHNSVTLMGHMVAPIEIRNAGNATVADFRLGVNHKYKDKDGTWHTEPNFFQCVLWNPWDSHKELDKGDLVLVTGRLKQDQWEQDGQKRSAVKVIANSVKFIRHANEKTQDTHKDPEPEIGDDDIPF